MSVVITEYLPEHVPAVVAFNERLAAKNVEFRLPATALSDWMPANTNQPAALQTYLALQEGTVRGGFTLRRQGFTSRGKVVTVMNYQAPVSEGVYDRRYMMVGVQMLKAALHICPGLYALGMGGTQQPLPKLLAASGWSITLLPFQFKVLQAANFLREIQALRQSASRRFIADLAATSGLGPLVISLTQSLRTGAVTKPTASFEVVDAFGDWADLIWNKAQAAHALIAYRDAATMNAIFPADNVNNTRLLIRERDKAVGWAVVRSTPMRQNKYFGNLRVGSIVDCLCLPGSERGVIRLAVDYLRSSGADLVVSNQARSEWSDALKAEGFFNGPSNFALACSPALDEAIGSLKANLGKIHMNRADGDGPIHL